MKSQVDGMLESCASAILPDPLLETTLHGHRSLSVPSVMGRFSPDSWTPAVNVLTWYLLVTAALSVLTRLGTKWWIFRKLTTDDYLSVVSLVHIKLPS